MIHCHWCRYHFTIIDNKPPKPFLSIGSDLIANVDKIRKNKHLSRQISQIKQTDGQKDQLMDFFLSRRGNLAYFDDGPTDQLYVLFFC